MKIDWNKKYTTIAVYGFLVIMASIIFYLILNNIDSVVAFSTRIFKIFTPFILAFCIAYILNPILKFAEKYLHFLLERKKQRPKLKRNLGILIIYILLLLILFLFSWVIFPQILRSLTTLSEVLSKFITDFPDILSDWMGSMNDLGIMESLITALIDQSKEILYQASNLLNTALPYIINFTKQITSGVSNVIIAIIVSIYLLVDKERFFKQIKKLCYAILPEKNVNQMIDVMHTSHDVFSKFIIGKLLDSAIIGVLCFVGMSIFRMPYALFISFIVGITNIIPYFGPFIGAIPSTLILLMISPVKAFWFLVFILILQQFDGNVLGPKILGKSTGLSAFWVIFSIILFGSLFGLVGMFIGVPLFSVLYYLIRAFVEKRLEEKQINTDENCCAEEDK